MNDPLTAIKARVRALKPYSLTPDRGRIKINQNENPWDAPARVKERTIEALRSRAWSRYPDFVPVSLHERLAHFSNWTPDGIVAGNGSNELIQALLMVTVGEGRKVLISEPTFALYRQISTVLNGDIVSVPLKDDFSFDIPALIDAIKQHTPAVTIVCSPNNPTGSVVTDIELELLLEATDGIVAVDEAYFDFSGHSARSLLSLHRNLAVFRTFSKAMAMAALRIGYLLADPALAKEVSKAVLPYNMNAISQAGAEAALDLYEEELCPLVEAIVAERDRLFVALSQIEGLVPVASRANFMIVKSAIKPKSVFNELLQRDILIRDVSGYPMLSDYFRVSVGRPEENEALITALREIFSHSVVW